MADLTIKSEVEYGEVFETFSEDFRQALTRKAAEVTDNFLFLYGEPKDYRSFRGMGRIFAESLALWLVAEGYVVLDPSHTASEEERAARPSRPEPLQPVPARERTLGAYL